ncbi:nuclear transport factor 2 family protein [Microvirga ossetica]|uniref:nuclear transport factor 2 family protein n=1 Tax=Microvirga ossetica TaxID=1882682 RepID=UPI000C14B08A
MGGRRHGRDEGPAGPHQWRPRRCLWAGADARGIKKGVGPLDQWHRRTIVLRRRDGVWKISHEHSSFPMRMDGSGTAATDLVP